MLIKKGGANVNTRDLFDNTPLHDAALNGKIAKLNEMAVAKYSQISDIQHFTFTKFAVV